MEVKNCIFERDGTDDYIPKEAEGLIEEYKLLKNLNTSYLEEMIKNRERSEFIAKSLYYRFKIKRSKMK